MSSSGSNEIIIFDPKAKNASLTESFLLLIKGQYSGSDGFKRSGTIINSIILEIKNYAKAKISKIQWKDITTKGISVSKELGKTIIVTAIQEFIKKRI